MARHELTTFICLFHLPERAEAAVSALEQAGFNRDSILSVWADKGEDAGSLDEDLTGVGVPGRDLQRLKNGIAKGGVVLSLDAPEDRSDKIEAIFHRYSADKIDETDVQRPAASAADGQPLAPGSNEALPVTTRDSAVVPLAAEELVVGKRDVSRGGVRVFRRTVEEPVSEALNLHEERVVIDRRPVDRPVRDGDVATAEQVIELTETEEIPVISKVARVVEEVHVGVVGSDRTETIQDTVRHVEVEMESVPEPTTSRRTPRGGV